MATNLHRRLAPISDAAWEDMEGEISDRFRQHVAGRRVADMPEAKGYDFAALRTGNLAKTDLGVKDLQASVRQSLPVLELRVPFKLSRAEIDNVLRGEVDPDWSPAEEAAELIAEAEDAAVFQGVPDQGIRGIKVASHEEHTPIELPTNVEDYPAAVAKAISELRLAGVEGPYALLLSAEHYTAISETTDQGYPVFDHVVRQLREGRIVWAPSINDAVLVSDRGGDFELHLGQDLSVGYQSHDSEYVYLYLEETLTVRIASPEAAVVLKKS